MKININMPHDIDAENEMKMDIEMKMETDVEMEMEEQPPLIGGSKPKEKKKKGKGGGGVKPKPGGSGKWSAPVKGDHSIAVAAPEVVGPGDHGGRGGPGHTRNSSIGSSAGTGLTAGGAKHSRSTPSPTATLRKGTPSPTQKGSVCLDAAIHSADPPRAHGRRRVPRCTGKDSEAIARLAGLRQTTAGSGASSPPGNPWVGERAMEG